MLRALLIGAAAGAVGTAALNIVTYADMAIRGRASSTTPAQMAGTLMEGRGFDLSAAEDDDKNRWTGLGALFGYGTGLGVGAGYSLLRTLVPNVPIPAAGLVLGLAAMAGSDVPATRLGVTDPTTWSASSWASDVVPHLAYGLVTALAYEAFAGR